jgi:MraZ protein
MDDRGRIPIPPRYRDAFRPGAVLSQGSPNLCLRLYTLESFELMAHQFTAPSPLHQKGKDLRLNLFSRSHDMQLDPQGRLLVPATLREYAGLGARVYLVGAGEWMELWEPDNYRSEMARIDAALPSMLESIEDRR